MASPFPNLPKPSTNSGLAAKISQAHINTSKNTILKLCVLLEPTLSNYLRIYYTYNSKPRTQLTKT